MSRPRKCRKVCSLPNHKESIPVREIEKESTEEKNLSTFPEIVTMTVDEYETIRLIDKQDFSQEECSAYMKIARTTVQQIYNNARKKVAKALVDGLPIRIEGGDYHLCDGKEDSCGCGGCRKHSHSCKNQEQK